MAENLRKNSVCVNDEITPVITGFNSEEYTIFHDEYVNRFFITRGDSAILSGDVLDNAMRKYGGMYFVGSYTNGMRMYLCGQLKEYSNHLRTTDE